MYNRLGPSELAVRMQENMASGKGAVNVGRRPQTQENMGNRGGRRSTGYRNMMQMRNQLNAKDQKQVLSDNGSSSMGD